MSEILDIVCDILDRASLQSGETLVFFITAKAYLQKSSICHKVTHNRRVYY